MDITRRQFIKMMIGAGGLAAAAHFGFIKWVLPKTVTKAEKPSGYPGKIKPVTKKLKSTKNLKG